MKTQIADPTQLDIPGNVDCSSAQEILTVTVKQWWQRLRQLLNPGLVPLTKFDWANTVAAAALVLLTSVTAQAQDPEVIRFDVSLVTLNVAVKDGKGRPLQGLQPHDFLVTDENIPVTPEFFDSEGPASIVFVIDTSSSMSGPRWKSLISGLRGFLKKAREGNDYTLIAFDRTARSLAVRVDAVEILKVLSELRPYGETALYDGVLLGLEALKSTPQRHKALVLISDGEDNSSRTGLADVEKEAFARRTTIYSIGLHLNEYCRHGIVGACNGKAAIKQLATVTGGLASFPEAQELSGVLKEIGNDVYGQYSLSYYPPDKKAGWRTVRVTVAQTERQPHLRYQERYLMTPH